MTYQGLYEIEGLQFVPVNEFKRPIVKNWQASMEKHNLDMKGRYGVGIVCGVPSGNVECLDVDLKYDLTGNLFDRYKAAVHEINGTLLSKLVLQKTKSGGYHLIYRCQKISGNIKLANRLSTDEEKNETYQNSYKAEVLKDGVSELQARAVAKKHKEGDKVKVLFETRGLGGQFVCHPTPGYEFVYGDLCSITEITPEERDVLISTAMSFNEVFEEAAPPKAKSTYKIDGVSPFDDYNQRGDVINLLQNHGWKFVKRRGQKTLLLRPGQTTSESSGNFDHEKNWFSVFTTSSEFEPMKAYLPYAVFAKLECNNDFSEAAKKLIELGYGTKKEKAEERKQPSTRVIQSRIDTEDNDFSFLATASDYDGYLQQVIDGTLPQGLTTGSPLLDEFFMFKEGNLVMTNGHDNTGKSVFTWWLLLLAAMYHGWCGIIFSSENTLGAFMRKMIQFYWSKPLRGEYAMTNSQYLIAKTFIENHFSLIKAQEDLFNYKDIINMVKKARKTKKYDYGMIDPYNSLKIDLSGFSKLSTHEYHYEALSEIKSYGQQTKFGWFVNHHAVTAALRAKDGEKKYPIAPQKADTEGGGKVSNKADDFITIHRITQHPTDWMLTELHVRKIKDTETGGKVTSIDNPVKFEMYKGGCAFVERLEGGGRGIDPVQEWHYKRGEATREQQRLFPTEMRLPYKDSEDTIIGF